MKNKYKLLNILSLISYIVYVVVSGIIELIFIIGLSNNKAGESGSVAEGLGKGMAFIIFIFILIITSILLFISIIGLILKIIQIKIQKQKISIACLVFDVIFLAFFVIIGIESMISGGKIEPSVIVYILLALSFSLMSKVCNSIIIHKASKDIELINEEKN